MDDQKDQFILDLPELQFGETPSLDNFVVGQNDLAVKTLREIKDGVGPKFMYIFGPRGCGLTHLLESIDPGCSRRESPIPGFSQGKLVYAVDNVDELDPGFERALLNLQNEVFACKGARLVCSGRKPIAQLDKLSSAVKSRLGWGAVYQIYPLSGKECLDALDKAARARGIRMTKEILNWMSLHLSNDMKTFVEVLDVANQLGLYSKKKVTLGLIKEAAALAGERGSELNNGPDAEDDFYL